jgi:hypothetical protein
MQAAPEEQAMVVMLCCGIKPMCGWNCERTASTCRERCGGQGYLSCNRFGSIIAFSHATVTAEGDNRVLMQKVAKEFLAIAQTGATKQRLLANEAEAKPVCFQLFWLNFVGDCRHGCTSKKQLRLNKDMQLGYLQWHQLAVRAAFSGR